MSDDDMCPNCVTPWKCNGPHEPAPTDETRCHPCEDGEHDRCDNTAPHHEDGGTTFCFCWEMAPAARIFPDAEAMFAALMPMNDEAQPQE